MALVLSSARSSTMEPLRKNRWVIQFGTIPGGGAPAELAFVAKTTTVPGLSFQATQTDRLNEKFFIAGKPTWDDLSMTFYDFIQGNNSAGEMVYNWAQNIYNPVTGQMFPKSVYATTATLAQLDPAGGVVRLWNIFYIWPQSVKFGEGLDAASDDVCEVSVTFKYDYAIKGVDVSA